MLLAADPAKILKPNVPEVAVALIVFGVLCFVLMKYVFPKMEATFDARADAIDGGLERAARAQAEAAALLDEYRRQLTVARAEAARFREEARDEAYARRAEILTEAEDAREQALSAGRERLAEDRRAVLAELRPEIGALSVELAGRIVGESLVEEARERGTVERFLREVGADVQM
ncbi:F0F1 ATP synthase subunit B [Phytomonospora sp. NPDC050363]|uniref:F0F1 ATP synthase subunit B n=1 Tax=Phytomonospora sp. NPDC050363 TaxID=3155642 RepID=UPI0033D9CBE8